MNRLMGDYKRVTQVWLFGIGLVGALAANFHSVAVMKWLFGRQCRVTSGRHFGDLMVPLPIAGAFDRAIGHDRRCLDLVRFEVHKECAQRCQKRACKGRGVTTIRTLLFAVAVGILSIQEAHAALLAPTQVVTGAQLYLSLGVLVFGLIILAFQMILQFKLKKGWGIGSTRVFGLTVVIFAGLFLITAGYSQEQIAPMIGLLGTIAGYLLGKSDESKS